LYAHRKASGVFIEKIPSESRVLGRSADAISRWELIVLAIGREQGNSIMDRALIWPIWHVKYGI
jgi:hypothetical protein